MWDRQLLPRWLRHGHALFRGQLCVDSHASIVLGMSSRILLPFGVFVTRSVPSRPLWLISFARLQLLFRTLQRRCVLYVLVY